MNYSRKQLESFGEPFGESATRLAPGGGGKRIYGSGGGGPTTTTVNQANIPDWLRPQVESIIGGASQELFNYEKDADGNLVLKGAKPFVPYSTDVKDYVAGFSPLQEQVQENVANLQVPGQFSQATGFADTAAQGGVDSAQAAYDYGSQGYESGRQGQQMGTQGGEYYGSAGAGSGMLGQQLGIQGGEYYGDLASQIGLMGLEAQSTGQRIGSQAEQYAENAAGMGDIYGQIATDPDLYAQYMSPYVENVTDVQLQGLQRQADIARTQRGAQFAKAGAFGGARQAIENAEANRALASQMDAARAQGLQSAYQQAQAAINQRAQLGLQGLQGAQQGLGTALQGGQLGLSGLGAALQGQQGALQGVNAQLAGTAQGMQGAQVGLQGVDRQLAGTAQGMQGSQVGLQGVSGAQAGYGLANQAAANLANIGTQQLGAQTGILGLQNQIGGQQQSQEQQYINQAIQNYANTKEAPMQAFNQLNALVRGYAIPGTTSTQYQAQPPLANQLAGYGTAAIGATQLSNALAKGKKGGKVSNRGISNLSLYNAVNR
jgi:hypothetical protein